MHHHGNSLTHEINAFLVDQLEEIQIQEDGNLWPSGLLSPDDKGILPIAIGIEDGLIFIRTGSPMTWLAMTTDQAEDLIDQIANKILQIQSAPEKTEKSKIIVNTNLKKV